MTINSVFNIDIRSSIASSTKHQSTLTGNTNETLIITEDISDKKVKIYVNNTTNNNQNMDNDVERVRKKPINLKIS